MPLDTQRTRQYLKAFEFRPLFSEEMGWERYASTIQATVDSHAFDLSGIAEKRGLVAFLCSSSDGRIPDYATRRKIEAQVTKTAFEHIIIYADAGQTTQVWQWVKREAGKPAASREHTYRTEQTGEALIQKLQAIVFSLEEEESLTTVSVAGRVRVAFDVERITKRFYDRFKTEHAQFLKFIEGIPDKEIQRWYASVMINRLMFIYFIQKKGFLDANTNYLRTRLDQSKQRGLDLFYSAFLSPLFFEGFAKKESERSASANKLLGKVPYLNGGLFLKHQIEEKHVDTLEICDSAFEKLFDFFDSYQWHLDERPLRQDNEINPDVLGYIFEKYINQKEVGAYYSKEDITDYIGKNTIIPFLFDKAREKCRIAFEGEHSIWRLLHADPDRYVHDAVKKGADLELPPQIAAGEHSVGERRAWNTPAAEEFALPTEIWREVVARRKRYQEVRSKLAGAEVRNINELITYNLDVRQFAQDVIQDCEGPELLRAFWHAVETVTVLDPACGSGAFLFAALNIMEPLYEACLDRMRAFVDELERSSEKHRPEKFSDFRKILTHVSQHPNPRYFILKSIIINNLFGVDIMEEATEICKLRLFLKLVAQVERNEQIEPLPDIDFNIRAGNALVGYATYDEVKKSVGSKLDFEDAMSAIEEKAQGVDRLFALFRQQQTEFGGEVTAGDKRELSKRLGGLENELNSNLASEYGVKERNRELYKRWLKSHKPFHWFIQFHSIMRNGGFDVVIGNPPWKEYSAVRKDYTVRGYTTEACGNLHGMCTERALGLRSHDGVMSFIVQLPMTSSSRMSTVRNALTLRSEQLFLVPFDDRPGKLFEGLQNCRSVIFISKSKNSRDVLTLSTTRYQRWPTEARGYLFQELEYAKLSSEPLYAGLFPKYANATQNSLFGKIKKKGRQAVAVTLTQQKTKHFIFYQEATRYWVKATVGLPYYAKNGKISAPAHGRYLFLRDARVANTISAVLNSSLFYLYFIAYGDCFHLSDRLVSGFPITKETIQSDSLDDLNRRLMEDLGRNAGRKVMNTKGGDEISYDEFYASKSKPIIDEIDRVLARHYGFTDEELDFIINYDIKYRMGLGADQESEE